MIHPMIRIFNGMPRLITSLRAWIISYNIRGLGGKLKKKKRLMGTWDTRDFQWEFKPFEGRTGGLIIIRRNPSFDLIVEFVTNY
ncbi:hypothetical protein CR513_62422, partial [Mucuna pruriens]